VTAPRDRLGKSVVQYFSNFLEFTAAKTRKVDLNYGTRDWFMFFLQFLYKICHDKFPRQRRVNRKQKRTGVILKTSTLKRYPFLWPRVELASNFWRYVSAIFRFKAILDIYCIRNWFWLSSGVDGSRRDMVISREVVRMDPGTHIIRRPLDRKKKSKALFRTDYKTSSVIISFVLIKKALPGCACFMNVREEGCTLDKNRWENRE
jgi:hypothetical protein